MGARQHLATWRSVYPGEVSDTAPVFLTRYGDPLTRGSMRKLIAGAVRRAGVDKYVHLYLFRHSRITHMVEDGVNESVIKLQAWGNLRSPMLATYAHVSNMAIDREMLSHAGVVTDEKPRPDPLKPTQCPQCAASNRQIIYSCSRNTRIPVHRELS